jgi:hypothetical protein
VIQALAWAWQQRVSPAEKLVLLCLADHCNSDGECWPATRRLRQFTGLSRRSIFRTLARLVERQQIRLLSGAKDGRTSRYFLAWTDPEGSATTARGSATVALEGCHSDSGGVSPRHPPTLSVTVTEPSEKRAGDYAPAPATGSAPAPSPGGITFQIPTAVQAALAKCIRLGSAPRLRDPAWWQAHVRARPELDFARELLSAEAWIASNPARAPRKDYARFFHAWLRRADAPPED